MPTGCGTWPAFWLTNEQDWPRSGEIDIVEAANTQSRAKMALHTSESCSMEGQPLGVMTGDWDTATGIPDDDTGIPNPEFGYATNCYVYDKKQWTNQGCVAVENKKDSIGEGFNNNGGGVYVLEWDPDRVDGGYIRSWVFPKGEKFQGSSDGYYLPENLRRAMLPNISGRGGGGNLRNSKPPDVSFESSNRMNSTTSSADVWEQPDPNKWGLPYGYFSLNPNTCPASHFRNMNLIFNLAFCGSVAGAKFSVDCPEMFEKYGSCEAYVRSEEGKKNIAKDGQWEINGVYIFEREFVVNGE